MIIGHIGARKASKGLPGKNFREICGKPLIAWSYTHLTEAAVIDHVVISTDDEEIYTFGQEHGALDIGLRPPSLSGDTVAKWAVWQDSLAKVEALGIKVEALIDLDCTNPLRDVSDIENALGLFREQDADLVMSCCEARKNPYFNLLEYDDQGYLKVSKTLAGSVVARQAAPTVLEHVASTYVISPTYLRANNFLYGGKVLPYMMGQEKSFDIDSPFDFEIVEFLLKKRLGG
ncbi:acylneuraminate cytidylyltransferase family protein [Parasphingorhabdus sp.]|jgi:CMP-N,N'-diacetyllegionaminic acid synthase|uniref:acylneuraminate cytidylyltransferase family protein n=1 Tax=Parasphingorhabdus sp. TaxID=2709688 RepID=UPI0032EEE1F9